MKVKVCENPKCPFHIDVEECELIDGVYYFNPISIIKINEKTIPSINYNKSDIQIGKILLHKYRYRNQLFYLCQTCNQVVSMIRERGGIL